MDTGFVVYTTKWKNLHDLKKCVQHTNSTKSKISHKARKKTTTNHCLQKNMTTHILSK